MLSTRFDISPIKLLISVLLLSLCVVVYEMVIVSGEQTEPQIALLRLEDVGPGGQYASLEQLGKLRAVLEYLRDQGVSYQIGVIPKWVNYSNEGLIYSKSLDQTEDPYVAAFDRILQDAERSGAVVGLHGYTHQVGEEPRGDGHQESAIGNEFDVANVPESATEPFAEDRLKEGLKIFGAAGLRPAFWETPHYHSAKEQHRVFRSYFGIIYENKPNEPRQPFMVLDPERNTGYGHPSAGTAYVPTPFSFIPYNRDERLIVNQLSAASHKDTARLPSFFYHAFLEFKHLIPVLDAWGNPVIRDGVPEYRYPNTNKTNLQRLVAAFKDRGYQFYSLYDYVPFVPSVRAEGTVPDKDSQWEDATGDGQTDRVRWQADSGAVTVYPGQYRDVLRNAAQPAGASWAVIPKGRGDLFALKDENGDGRQDLWIVRAAGKVELYRSTGASFTFTRSWKLPAVSEWEELYVLRQPHNGIVLAGLTGGGLQLDAYVKQGNEWQAVETLRGRSVKPLDLQQVQSAATGAEQLVYCKPATDICYRMELPAGQQKWQVTKQSFRLPDTGGLLKLGDFNGDGREDVLAWNKESRKGTVFRQSSDGTYAQLTAFGPWGEPGSRLLLADFDGNGKLDIAAVEPDGAVDTALSFQTAE